MAYLAFGHVRLRVEVWLDPFAVRQRRAATRSSQSLFGFANGGMFGTGLGRGYPQLVPYAKSDFIIAALGEELGLTGVFAIIVLFAILVERGAAHRASPAATRSARCWPPGSRSSWACRSSSSSAASPG